MRWKQKFARLPRRRVAHETHQEEEEKSSVITKQRRLSSPSNMTSKLQAAVAHSQKNGTFLPVATLEPIINMAGCGRQIWQHLAAAIGFCLI